MEPLHFSPEDPIGRSLEALHAYVNQHESLDDTLTRIAAVAVDALGADMAGLTLLTADGRAATTVFTDDTAPELDQAQYEADRGPCLHALRLGSVVRVDSTDADDRWPEFLDAARAHGIHSSLSLPLLVAGDGIGALNLYAEPPSRFSDSSEVVGQAIAAHAAVAVANGIAYWEKVTLAEQLETALTSRAIIEQAKGVIIATTGRSAEEAFVLLREQSQAQNVKLRDVAAEIVERQQRRT